MNHKGTVHLETDRLILRRFTMEDAEAMFANWCNDTDVTKFLMWQPHGTIETTRQVLSEWLAGYENRIFTSGLWSSRKRKSLSAASAW